MGEFTKLGMPKRSFRTLTHVVSVPPSLTHLAHTPFLSSQDSISSIVHLSCRTEAMLRSLIVLLSCGVGYFVYAHPHCHYDQRGVDVERDLTFCSMDYAPEGICCTEAEETALEATFNAVGDLTAECADYYKQVRHNLL